MTVTVSRLPTSAAVGSYVSESLPTFVGLEDPSRSTRVHWKVKSSGKVGRPSASVMSPMPAVNALPTCAVPVMASLPVTFTVMV